MTKQQQLNVVLQ